MFPARHAAWKLHLSAAMLVTPVSTRSFRLSLILSLALLGVLFQPLRAALARDSGDPIRLKWMEGDVAGLTPILSADGKKQIGFIEYHQRREGDRLEATRIARFNDGSSDEDQVEARIGKTLEGVRGRSIIRDTKGRATVDIKIDIPKGRITGFSGLGDERENYDDEVELPPGTYWGPLIFIVVKNFDLNAADGKLVFRTVAPTPKPRVIDLELVREGTTDISRPGGKFDTVRYTMKPTIAWIIDPIIQRLAPTTTFFVKAGEPPALARYTGPRNYAGQEMRLE